MYTLQFLYLYIAYKYRPICIYEYIYMYLMDFFKFRLHDVRAPNHPARPSNLGGGAQPQVTQVGELNQAIWKICNRQIGSFLQVKMKIIEIFELPQPSWKLYGKTKNVTLKSHLQCASLWGGGGLWLWLSRGCFCYNFSLLPTVRSPALLRSAHASFTRFTMEVSEAPQQLPKYKGLERGIY